MFQKIKAIDWESLDAAELPRLLGAASSKKHDGPRLEAIGALHKFLAPWQLMEGYASERHWEQLDRLIDNDIPYVVIPFLIEILHDLSRYVIMADEFNTPPAIEFGAKLRTWGTRIREKVLSGIAIYRVLLFDEERDVRIMANELLRILGDEYFIPAWSHND